MEETGVVKSTQGPFAVVAIQRKSFCDQCKAGACHLTDGGAELEALNNVGAKVGSRVRVVLKPYSYLKGSVIVYGLPALALIAGAVIGREVAAPLGYKDPETISAVLAFGALALSFLFVKLWSIKADKKMQYKPVIEEILDYTSKGEV